MESLLLLGVLAGVDNLQVAAALGIAPLARRRRLLLLVAFAACEIASPLIGVFFAHVLRARFGISFAGIGPYVVAACGIAIVCLALRDKDLSDQALQDQALRGQDGAGPLINSRWTLIGLPISLSFDNLLIGISASTLGYPPAQAALVIGGTSAALCGIGILAGARIARLIPRHAELVSGCALIIIAASMWIRS